MIAAPSRARSQTAVLRRVQQERSVILGYHGIANCRRLDDLFQLQVSPVRFRRQLEMMLAAGFRFVTVAELANEAGGRRPPAGLAAVSFDDAMRNVITAALPIMSELGIRGTVYVPTDWLNGRSPWIGPGGDGAILAADELQDLARAGWELGSHTRSHADLSRLDYHECMREIGESCEALRQLAASAAQTLAYPFGRYGPAAIAAARDIGLIGAVTTGSGSWAPYELTRAMIGPSDPFPVVLLKILDRYEILLRGTPARVAHNASKKVRGSLVNLRSARVDRQRGWSA